MFFSDLYKSPKATLSKFRHSLPPETCDYGDPDLLSKDKIKQKAAVKKFLAEKIRNDWEFTWPPVKTTSSSTSATATGAGAPTSESVADIEPNAEHAAQTSITTTATASPPTITDGTDTTPHSPPSENATVLAVPSPPTSITHTDSQAIPAPLSDGLQAEPPVGFANGGITTHQDLEQGKYDVAIDDDHESDGDTSSIYSIFSEDEAHFRPRLEWTSELSDSSEDDDTPASCRFESPETVGETVRARILSKKEKRRRAVIEEATWNVGLACFEARRDAWTGAKTVRFRKKPVSPTTGFSPRRLFFRSPPATPLSSSPTERKSGDSAAVLSDASDPHKDSGAALVITKKQTKSSTASAPPSFPLPVETIIPIAPPILPPANPMRASITPAVYPALYDKLVLNGLTPSCPVNLADMLRACVCGWKRDGEWPPRATMAPPPMAIRKKKRKTSESGSTARRMSFGLLGRDKDGGENASGGGIRRSMQRILGIHHHHPGAA
jgi:hypothetical protein